MIIKISSRKQKSFRQLLVYMFKVVGGEIEAQQNDLVVTHNLRGHTIDQWVQEFEANEQFRKRKRKNSVYLTHEILAWHEADNIKLDIEKLKSNVKQYISFRNPNGMYVAVAHTHQKHYHIHMCVAGIEYRSGKTMRMSRADMKALKRAMESFQRERYPELIFSRVQHGKEIPDKNLDTEYQIERRTRKPSRKEQLKQILIKASQKAKSWQDFHAKLGEMAIVPYYRNRKLTGFRFEDGKKYRLRTLGLEADGLSRLSKDKPRDIDRN